MAKRVLVVLSGCGAGDGSDIHESILTLLAVERAGARPVCAAPALPGKVFDHLHNQPAAESPARQALVESARLARGQIQDLGAVSVDDFDGLIVPGGAGVGDVLSNYAQKAQLCEVNPHLVNLFKAALSSHRPMGFLGLAAVLVARVLGPVAGVRVTLGARTAGTATATKNAAVMGADVRPSAITDIFIDKKSRVITSGVFMHEEIRLAQAAQAIEKLVRTVVHLSRDRSPVSPPAPEPKAAGSSPSSRAAGAGRPATPGRGSV